MFRLFSDTGALDNPFDVRFGADEFCKLDFSVLRTGRESVFLSSPLVSLLL